MKLNLFINQRSIISMIDMCNKLKKPDATSTMNYYAISNDNNIIFLYTSNVLDMDRTNIIFHKDKNILSDNKYINHIYILDENGKSTFLGEYYYNEHSSNIELYKTLLPNIRKEKINKIRRICSKLEIK